VDPMYCTREQVKQAINVTAPSWVDSQIDREIQSSSLLIDADMKRPDGSFWPVTDLRYFDWLPHQFGITWRLWLDGNDLAAQPTSVVSGGVDITAGILARNGVDDSTAPFNYLETNLASNATFSSTDTYQRAVAVGGVFMACPIRETTGGTLSALNSTTTTTAVVSNGTAVGVGSVIRVDTERCVITDKTFADSALTLQANLTANSNATLVALSAGTVAKGEVLLIDAEEMLVTAVAGSNAVVKRAWEGSALAAHTSGATVYANRGVTLLRGALGTTAATHAVNAPINVHQVPTPVQTLAIAETLRAFGLERAGYTTVIERGSMTKVTTADALWKQVRQRYRRGPRIRTAARVV